MSVRSRLHAAGYRFRLHRRDLPGSPDIVLKKHGAAVFVHGCFWHGHDCRKGKRPTTNTQFWDEKLSKNCERDAAAQHALAELGWNVFVIWECELEAGTARLLGALSTEKHPNSRRNLAKGTKGE